MSTSDPFDDHVSVVLASKSAMGPSLAAAGEMIGASLATGGTCFAFGNGGSAADAQHFVAELVGHFDRPRPARRAVALTTDPSVMTSVANDLGFDQVFARQVDALARPGDVVLAISTSGRSANVLAGALAAVDRGALVVGLTGGGAATLAEHCDLHLEVPSSDTQRVQEVHTLCLHILVGLIERRLGGHGD